MINEAGGIIKTNIQTDVTLIRVKNHTANNLPEALKGVALLVFNLREHGETKLFSFPLKMQNGTKIPGCLD